MSSRSQETIYLKDYLPPQFSIDSVDLHFDIYDHEVIVTNSMQLERASTQSHPLVLDGNELELIHVKLDGTLLTPEQYQLTDSSLTISETPQSFHLEIQTKIFPEKNKSYEGLYFSKSTLVTQNEAQGFRRLTYFLDRPDVMTTFKTTICADQKKYPVLLSNGNLTKEEKLENGRHLALWEDPTKKPCYLYALVAGDLGLISDEFTTQSGRKVDLRIYCEKGVEDRCHYAMHALKLSMKWDEDKFGREYDLDIYMIVAIDDFNAGAMENKGLNVFNSVYVLADEKTATDSDYEGVLGVIGHEYFHNWTGNRITLRDWFQLSLKEGLTVYRDQEFTSDLTSRAVKRIDDINLLRTRQFSEDAGPSSHPVRPSSVISVDNFFTVTIYEKGAEVIRMMETLLGKDGFRKGMDLYFERHDESAVTINDFAAAMEDANGFNLNDFKSWYDQAGTPIVRMSSEYDSEKSVFTLHFEQLPPANNKSQSLKPFVVPIRTALLNNEGQNLPLDQGEEEKVLILDQNKKSFVFKNISEAPKPSVLRDFSAPIRLETDFSKEDLAFYLAHETDAFCQWEAGQKLVTEAILEDIEKKNTTTPEVITHAFSKVIQNQNIENALKAQLLALPEESYISQFMDEMDVDAIHQIRKQYYRDIAIANSSQLAKIYQENSSEKYSNSQEEIHRRKLKNTALSILVKSEENQFYDLALQQLKKADNMTDQIAALFCLSRSLTPQRQEAIEFFRERWGHESLVMNKLLRTIGSSPIEGSLDEVKSYMDQPIFNSDNPNKVYSLIMSFGASNPTQFHKEDGSGYQFLAEQVLFYDNKNPHVASYLAGCFNHWKKTNSKRRELAQKHLQEIKSHQGLSGNTYEIVSKALDI